MRRARYGRTPRVTARLVSCLVVAALAAPACGNRMPPRDLARAERTATAADATPADARPVGEGDASQPSGPADSVPAASGAGSSDATPVPGASSGGGASGASVSTGPAGRGPATPAAPAPAGSGRAAATGQPSPAAAQPAPGGAGTGQAGPAVYDSGASDTEIRFGSVSSLTGITDVLVPTAARAYFKYLNATRGGVNGRKLTWLLYDDQFDVTRNAALTRQAFESDKVFAFVAANAPVSAHGGLAYIDQQKIPVIGGDVSNLFTWGKSPMYYPQAHLESVNGARMGGRWAVEIGCKKVAGFGSTIEVANKWTTSFEEGLKDRGNPGYVYYTQLSPAEIDYTSYVATARSKGADCLTYGAGMPYFARMRKAMAQQNYFPQLLLPSSSYDPLYVESTQGQPRNDYSVVQYDVLENAGKNPAIKEFADNLKKYEPSARPTGFQIMSWAAAKIAAEAIRRMGDNLTRKNLIDTLDQITGYDTGITLPTTYRPGPHPGPTCANIIRLTDSGAWTVVKASYCL